MTESRSVTRNVALKDEMRYRTLLEISPDAIVIARNQAFVMVNEAAVKLFRVNSPEELIGRRLEDFVAPEFLASVQEALDSLFSSEVQLQVREMRLVCGGSAIDVEIAGASCMDEDGATVHAVIRDVTRRKQAEDSLRLSEARLRALTDSAQDAILMMDQRGAITYWNPAAELILGYSREEVIGKDLHQLIAPARYHEAHRKAFPEYVRSGHGNAIGKTVELAARRKDGREITVDLSLSATFQNGEWHAIGIVREITRRKLGEQALRESEEKFRQLAENIREVFFVLTPTDRLLYLSPAFEQIWGECREKVYQDPSAWQKAIHPDDVESVRVKAASRRNGQPVQFEYRIRTPDGIEKWIRSRSFPVFGPAGEVIRIVGFAEEITEQKRYEGELIQARVGAEAANRAKSMFLAAMSHELRTPLNAILGFSELLEVEMGDRGIHDWDMELKKIRRAGNHLLSLISDVLDFSKIETGRFELQPESFDMAALVYEVAEGVEHLAVKNRVEIQVSCEPMVLYGDRLRIGQCLFNLVGNACKFTKDGRVAVEGKLDRRSDGEWYTVRVTDTGIGIRREDLDRLFTWFTQLEASSARKFGGAGLGLAISRKLSRLMGGDITVESSFGQGSTFTFRIPIAAGSLLRKETEKPEIAESVLV